MKYRLRKRTVLFFAGLLLAFSCGTSRKNSSPNIRRIISLSPHITEILYALGQQNRLVAVSDFCTFPPQAAGKEKIGGLLNPNPEKMVALQPDLCIGTKASSGLREKLPLPETRFVFLANDKLEDVYTTIDSLGILLNCRRQADSLRTLLKDSLRFYSAGFKDRLNGQPGALLVIGREAGSTRNITAAGGNTFISQVWQQTGAANVFADLPVLYAQVSREALLEKQADLIIEFKFKENWNADKDLRNLQEWQGLSNLRAVKRKNIFVINGDYSLIPGPRLYLLARDYGRILEKYLKRN